MVNNQTSTATHKGGCVTTGRDGSFMHSGKCSGRDQPRRRTRRRLLAAFGQNQILHCCSPSRRTP